MNTLIEQLLKLISVFLICASVFPANADTKSQAQFRALAEAADKTETPAIAGKDDWLFLVSELRALGRDAFWGKDAASPNVDPFLAVTDLNEKLKALNIDLIVCPAPPRAVIYADKILEDPPRDPQGVLQRSDGQLQGFYDALRKAGVSVLDMTETLMAARSGDEKMGPVSCEQDSHWSPRGLGITAKAVAAEIRKKHNYAAPDKVPFTLHGPEPLSFVGDLVTLVPAHPSTKRNATITRVTQDAAGSTPLVFDDDSPVLLLSDSHGLVFSDGDDMHSSGAGFAEQLSAELGFAVDRMARRGSGDQIRSDIARRFITKPDEAAKKQVLVYLFAARTFSESKNWKVVPLKR
ncbi:MAG: hypothetical protein OSB41_11985 [Kiritimatiellae bacterium]|nr:hypothetical protein [Kiritimatiellia bacterium]